MKLPDIDYGGNVESTVQTAALPMESASGTAKVISEGLRVYSQELLKSQQVEAALRVTEGLDAAKNAITARKYVTRKEVQDSLDGQVPPELSERLKIYGDNDTAQIPMWAVQDTLFEHQAKKAVESAAEGVSGVGWQSHFKEAIGRTVQEARQGMAQHSLQAMDAYLQETQRQQIRRFVAGRQYGAAMGVVMGSPEQASALSAAERQQWKSDIHGAIQESAAVDALSSNDPAEIKAQADRMRNDPVAREAIPEPRRKALAMGLEERYTKFESSRIAEEAFHDGLTPGTMVIDEGKSLAALETKAKGMTPELQSTARTLFKAKLADFNETRKNQTSGVFAYALADFDKPGPLQFKVAAVRPEVAAYLKNPANGREATELWDSLLAKEKSQEMHNRSMAEKPTDEQWKNYAILVRDMQQRPSYYAGLSEDRIKAETYGKVGPLVKDVMTLWKSTTAPGNDKRVLSGDERKLIMESLPPQYRPSNTTNPNSITGRLWSGMQQRIGDRKAAEWEDSKGPLPKAVMEKWVKEDLESGSVKGGRWDFLVSIDAKGVPKAVAPLAYPGKEWTPDVPGGEPAAPAPAPANEKVVVEFTDKTGKTSRLRIPKSRLADALRDGAKEVP